VAGRPPVAAAPSRGVRSNVERSPVRHDYVAPAAPNRFRIAGKAFRIGAAVCGMTYARPLDPPGDQRHTVCWVRRDFGVAPGSAARGTTYILGHAWAEAPLVLNRLSETAMRQALGERAVLQDGVPTRPVRALRGYRLTLHLPTGRLDYRVYRAFTVAKERAADLPGLMDQSVRNRVVLITCGELHGVDYDDNVVVYARLVSSRAANR
jgi:hypothetical protein